MKLAFSTLGCPNWSLSEIVDAVHRFRFDGVELRAVDGDLDLLNRPEFSSSEVTNTRRRLNDEGITVCCVDTSCSFHSTEANEREINATVAVKYAELAAALGSGLIRIFPDKVQPGANRIQTRDYIAETLHQVAERIPSEVSVGLETHGDFAQAQAAAEIVKLAAHANVSIIWDVANSRAAGDSITDAADVVGPYLRHVHLRDARAVTGSDHWLPVLAGKGSVSFDEAVAALESLNYTGFISFEWEKYWHPEIEEPEIALPDFVKAMEGLMSRKESVVL